jgi:hypothetical protein
MSSDWVLRREIERLVDGAAPPAPWLEQRVIAAVRAHGEAGSRSGPRPRRDFVAFPRFGSGARLAAGLVALLIALGTVGALLLSARLLDNPTVPDSRPTTAPSQSLPPTFTPSPAVRASNWPPGVTVPAPLAGAWQPENQRNVLYLGGYTWELGTDQIDNFGNLCGPGPCYIGNVVVNGSEIDFIDDTCTLKAAYGFERFTYTLTGNTLVLTRAQGPGQSACQWLLAGPYTRVSTP